MLFFVNLFLVAPVFFCSSTVSEAADAFWSIFNCFILGGVDDTFLAGLADDELCLLFHGVQLLESLECGGVAIVVCCLIISLIDGPLRVSRSNRLIDRGWRFFIIVVVKDFPVFIYFFNDGVKYRLSVRVSVCSKLANGRHCGGCIVVGVGVGVVNF